MAFVFLILLPLPWFRPPHFVWNVAFFSTRLLAFQSLFLSSLLLLCCQNGQFSSCIAVNIYVENISQISFSPSFPPAWGLLPAIEIQYRCLTMASYIRVPTDLPLSFLSDPMSHPLCSSMLCVPAALAFSLFLKCCQDCCTCFPSTWNSFPLVFSWWIPSFQPQSYVASSESLPKIPNLALPVLPPVITVTSLDVLHATYHCQKLFCSFIYCFSISLIKI